MHDFFMTRYVAAYAAEIAAFVASVKDGQEPHPAGKDGMIALALADAANLSVEKGGVVEMSEILD